jgi:hypothetical protein
VTGWLIAPLLPGLAVAAQTPQDAIAIRHTDDPTAGWFVAESPSFRLWHQQSRAGAERVLQAAEQARARVFRKWFSTVAGAWDFKCELYLYPSREAYHAATGLPPRAPGYAQTRHEGERVVVRRIDLRGDWPELL